ncbi:MAG: 2'-5' RNA ligase family protein [Eubacterium sp.]|nr:2'-5' RNA ligase family protein [Eubacterium sp.]
MTFDNTDKRDVLIMVTFPNIDKIKEIQKKYYDIADKIEPHIAVTFPFDSDISDEDLYEKITKVVEKYKPFRIICHGVSTPIGESNYRFLDVVENKDIIKSMSDDIYKNIVPEELEHRDKYNYVPHISLANKPLDKEIELDDTFEMVVDSLYVERIGSNDESIKLYDIWL